MENQLSLDLDKLLEQSQEHIEIIHEYKADGWITLADKKEGKYKQWHYKYKNLYKELEEVKDIVNIYISQNTFYKPQRRIETLRQLRTLYLDIDNYKLNLTKESVIYHLEQEHFNRTIPRPNLVMDSGRGLYLIWIIHPVPYQALPLWHAIQKYFYEQIKEFGADRAAIDPTRVLRLVGSINTKSGTTVKILDEYEYIYTLREIQQEYMPELTPKKNNKGRPRKIVSIFNQYSLYHARIIDLIKLVNLRNYDVSGYREIILFLYRYWTCCFTEDTHEALEKAIELNNKFTEPLSLSEVIRSTRSAEKAYTSENKEYKYKNSTIIDLLDISEQEEKQLKTIIGKREKYRRNNERRQNDRRNKNGLTQREQSKTDKIKKVKELHCLGFKQVDIAKSLEISKSVVSKIIKNRY